MGTLGGLQMAGTLGVGDSSASVLLLILGGLLAAGATVLPGGSGTFVLLLMGLYVPILKSVSRVKEALVARDLAALVQEAWTLAPFACGMLGGLITVSLVTKWSLARFPRATYGLLLGLLVGSVVGLWPFQRGVAPQVGDIVKGQVVTADMLPKIEPDDWPVRFFAPSAVEAIVAMVLVMVALASTVWLCRLEAKLEGRDAQEL
jgi:putative membrane protein